MTTLRLGYLGISTPDPREWDAFAQDVLGTTVDEGSAGGPSRLILGGNQPAVFLESAAEADVRYLGWEVQDAGAASAVAERLTKLGVGIVAASPDEVKQRAVDGIFAFDDPFGYRHEVYFGPHRHLTRRRTGDMEFPELGHAFLLVPDQEAAEQFYCAALGLSVSDHISFTMGATPFEPGPVPVDVSFLFASRRHHVLAVAGLPEGLPKRGLAHFMIEAESLDDVGRTYDACLDRGLLVTTIGRHTNDEVISFYLSAPGGVVIEYGWGGLLLSEENRSIPRYDAPSLWGHRPAASSSPS
jgi:biphenyl-2,3-diol 1,2-dioxygenase/3,4-dihydroxy-9,10-secoandrosta-1,3,5(10)-triene-9,17-dione 4,5-dioxygenase